MNHQNKRIFTETQALHAKEHLSQTAKDFGFDQVGVAGIDLTAEAAQFRHWLEMGLQGQMDYLRKHGEKRFKPELLVPNTIRVICVRLHYLFPGLDSAENLKDHRRAYVSRYALGRDYHKILRKRLKHLAQALMNEWGNFGYRVFVDSAPVLEKPLAVQAGLGWMGKHTLVLDKTVGSWFFLGEIYTDLPLPTSQPQEPSCGKCLACLKICPTNAFIAPYQLDARRCISYLTIEHKGPIEHELRPKMGNRIFGCDDCQLICPWNRWAKHTEESDFTPRAKLHNSTIKELLEWNEEQFLEKTLGSAIRRTGYWGWVRNLSIAAGNAPADVHILKALQAKNEKIKVNCPEWLLEHINDAIKLQKEKIQATQS